VQLLLAAEVHLEVNPFLLWVHNRICFQETWYLHATRVLHSLEDYLPVPSVHEPEFRNGCSSAPERGIDTMSRGEAVMAGAGRQGFAAAAVAHAAMFVMILMPSLAVRHSE
jgi:hypothetical protein